MPIHNLAKRKQLIPKLGNIRKGVKEPVIDKKTNKPKIGQGGEIVTYPKEVDYFVLKVDEAVPGLKEDVERVYGPKPKQLVAFLASADTGRAWDYWYEAYNFNQLIARSDGTVVTYLFDTETNQKIITNGQIVDVPKKKTHVTELLDGLGVGDILGYYDGMVIAKTQKDEPIFFDAVGRLNVVLRDLYRQAYWTVHTGGLYGDVPHLTEMVANIEKLAASINTPAPMIPFTLTRVEIQLNYTDDSGKKRRRKGWDIQMEILPAFFEGVMKAFASAPIALADVTPAPRLAAPDNYVQPDSPYVAETNGVEWDKYGDPNWNEEIPSDFDPEFLEEYAMEAVAREPNEPDCTPQFLVNEGIVDNTKHAEALMNLLGIVSGAPAQSALDRIGLYKKWRKKYPKKDKETPRMCAKKAIAGEVPPES